mmetsp:Transcript_26141/g.59103  ORF Transcript_26141/g.59103 Transcript_26141/m.59103 type:complete len:477 (-) Transcript_26141:33-1463(-)
MRWVVAVAVAVAAAGRVEEAKARVAAGVEKLPPDFRHQQCKDEESTRDQSKLPHAAIIIPYLNERWDHIFMTVRSLVANTNMNLIDDVIFVDDANKPDMVFREELEIMHPKIKVISNRERAGIVGARLAGVGAMAESTPIILFAEPHCLFAAGWYPPLAAAVAEDETTVAHPLVDVISDPQFHGYRKLDHQIGGFDYALTYLIREPAQARNASWKEPDPYPTPAMAGGIFAMSKAYFTRMGTYDEAQLQWGAENIEMSLRIWRCGGRIILYPCSRIGHWYRGGEDQPYKVDLKQVLINKKRTALVWLDDHIHKFYRVYLDDKSWPRSIDPRDTEVGDVQGRVQVRNQLDCKDMDWYADNVYPELKKQPIQLPMYYSSRTKNQKDPEQILMELKPKDLQQLTELLGRPCASCATPADAAAALGAHYEEADGETSDPIRVWPRTVRGWFQAVGAPCEGCLKWVHTMEAGKRFKQRTEL